ncbi:MAG TPA: winged helix-turn-helix domain-containing protein [Actinomycetes bacterium]|nr:winged helix-turn-helix domain-containing protein [Actinomycetes bacterium]
MSPWAQASIRSRLLGWRCEAVAAASSRQIRSRARSRWTAGVRPLPRPPETSSQWTVDRVAEVVERLTGVRLARASVWRLLHQRLGWTVQRPERQARERDEEAIARWVAYEWPRIKKGPA